MLEIAHLTKVYPASHGASGRIHVLDDIGLRVPANQFVCLLGASGCGKTTLLRIVAGLTEADSGSITIQGRTGRGPGNDRSLVFQNYGLLPWRSGRSEERRVGE